MTKTPATDLFNLDGRTAVVTGGAGIIGSRVCDGLAGFGAKVAVIDINGEGAERLAGEISARHNTPCIGVACDVSSPDAVSAMAETVTAELGDIRILHNNAATKTDDVNDFFAPFEEFKLSVWREIMAVNLDGMFLVAQAVGDRMVRHGAGGSIIQTASTYGIVGPDQRIYEGSEYLGVGINTPSVYSVSKAGVAGLTRYLATYWAEKGIRVNTLVPGGVESGQNETFKRNYASRVPMGRMAQRDEMVGAVIFMASDASSYMTGQTVVVDGGWTAW